MSLLPQAVMSGLISGTVYALLAMGLIIAFQTTRIVNLAHGETYAISGLVTAGLAHAGAPIVAAIAGGIATATVFSMGVERLLLRPRASWPVSGPIRNRLSVFLPGNRSASATARSRSKGSGSF